MTLEYVGMGQLTMVKKDILIGAKMFDPLSTSMSSNLGTVTSALVTKENGTGERF